MSGHCSRHGAGNELKRRGGAALVLIGWFVGMLSGLNVIAAGDYRIFYDTMDSGGGRGASAKYSANASLGGFGGVSQSAVGDAMNRHGFTGQLNSPPVAVDDVLRTPAGIALTIETGGLIANDIDPDGDLLIVANVQLAPGALGSLESSDGEVIYHPPPSFVGTITLFYTLSDGGDGITGGTITILVGRIAPAVTWADPESVIYGAHLTTNQLNAVADVPGILVYSPPVGTLLPAGDAQILSVTFTPEDDESYEEVTASVPIDVVPATLTVTAIDTARTVGSENPALTYSFTGFVEGEDVEVISGAPELGTDATPASPAGDYVITISQGTLSAANYVFHFMNGVLRVMGTGGTGPILQGTHAAIAAITDKQTVRLFEPVALINPAAPTALMTVTLALDDPLKGHFSSLGGFNEGPLRQYTFVGDAAATTAALRGLVFHPGENRVRVGLTETTVFTLTVNDGINPPISDAQARVVSTSVNDPPVVNGLSLERLENRTVKVAVSDLLASASDPDPDPLTLRGVTSSSAHGGTVEIDGNWVIYIPAVGFNQTDTFEYTVDDGHGYTATRTATVTIKGRDDSPTKNIIAMIPGSNGVMQITFIGIPGRAYFIEATPSLSPAFWIRLTTILAGLNGVFEYVDQDAPSFPQRYYRAIQP